MKDDAGKKLHAKKKPRKCPCCESKKIASIFYGYPGFNPDLEKKIEDKKIVLGGCCIDLDSPAWQCTDCGIEIFKEIDMEI